MHALQLLEESCYRAAALSVQDRLIEVPDYWLAKQNCFEVPREDVTYAVRFYGLWSATMRTRRMVRSARAGAMVRSSKP